MYRYLSLLAVTAFFLFGVNHLNSQDLHFTNNHMISNQYNPAQTGAYLGNLRASMIYRDQYRFNSITPYNSGAISVDSPIAFGLTKSQWIGVGLTMNYDKAGDVSQTWTNLIPSVAYHIGFDKDFNSVFTIGAQYGFANRSYDPEGARFENDIREEDNPDTERLGGENGDGLNIGYSDLNIGVMFKSKVGKTNVFEIGASMMHVLNPTLTFKGSDPSSGGSSIGRSKIGQRFNIHSKYRLQSTAQMTWEPSVWTSFTTGASIMMVQLRNEYYIQKGGDFAIVTGLGYRLGDSAQLLLGAKYKDWDFVASYDQSNNAFNGSAFEIGAMKTFIFNKKPEVKPIIYCPRM